MTIFHDGCTAGPLSGWLDGLIGSCCELHDSALDHSYDLGTFIAGNIEFGACIAAAHPLLAAPLYLAVASPVGLLLFWFGPKRKPE